MELAAAIQNLAFFAMPAVIYAAVVRWRARLSWSEIALRLGLALGGLRAFRWAFLLGTLAAILGAFVSRHTLGFEGSMLAPYVDVTPSFAVSSSIANYAFVATGFPEELLFRGLITGVLMRRLSFWCANLLQASVFMLPHLLLLFVAPSLWALAIFLPLALGLACGWLRQISGSIVPGVLVHTASNAAGALFVLDWAG